MQEENVYEIPSGCFLKEVMSALGTLYVPLQDAQVTGARGVGVMVSVYGWGLVALVVVGLAL